MSEQEQCYVLKVEMPENGGGVGLDIDVESRQVALLAKFGRPGEEEARAGIFKTFVAPENADLGGIRTIRAGDILEIVIPKLARVLPRAA